MGPSLQSSIQQILNSPLSLLAAAPPRFSYNDLMAEIANQSDHGITKFRRVALRVIAKKRKIDQTRKMILDTLVNAALVNRPKGSKALDTGKRLNPANPNSPGTVTSKPIPHGKNYLMEKLDPGHHFANDLAWLFDEYEAPPAKTGSFFAWVAGLSKAELRVLYQGKGWSLSDAELDQFMNGVEYLDEAQRVDYRLYVVGGRIMKFNGQVFNTTTMTSHDTSGRAMYVLSPEKEFYAAEGIVSQRHHSSLLAGAPVLCAGEIATDANGKLAWISASSGHYKPSIDMLRNAVAAFADKGISPQSYKVLAKEIQRDAKNRVIAPPPGTRVSIAVRAHEFMYSGKIYEVVD